MSLSVSNAVWAADFGAPTKKLVMLALANWSDDSGGRLYPAIRAIAVKATVSTSQARRIVHALIDDGVLSIVVSPKHRRGRARHYQIMIDAVSRLPRAEDCDGHPKRKRKQAAEEPLPPVVDHDTPPQGSEAPADATGLQVADDYPSDLDLLFEAFGPKK
jgi:hypothetical protein